MTVWKDNPTKLG